MEVALRMSGFLVKPDGSKRWWANFFTRLSSGTPYCRAIEVSVAHGIHQAADGGAFLGHRDEQLARLAVLEQADGEVALVAGDVELVRERDARLRQAAANGLVGCFELGEASPHPPSRRCGPPRTCLASVQRRPGRRHFAEHGEIGAAGGVLFLVSRQRRRALRAVAVDGDALEAHLPAFDVGVTMSSTVPSLGMLTVLEIAPLMNGCAAAIMRRCAR